jgi:predicted RNA-binding protein Jag
MATPEEIGAFVEKVVAAMGLNLKAEAEEMPDGLRINLTGEDGSLLIRRQGEALSALQHVVAAVFRSEVDERRRLVVDCQGYRKSKDAELKQMARFLAEIHLAVGEVESVSSESIGDAFEKTVIISVK